MRKVMIGEGIGQKEMQLAYNVYQRGMRANLHMLGATDRQDRDHAGRLGYYTYQRAVDKQVFDPGTRMLIALKQQYTIGKGYVTDTLDPDLNPNAHPDAKSFMGSGPMSLMNTVIRSTARRAHAARRWLQPQLAARRGPFAHRSNAGIKTIANIIRADDVVGPILAKWEQADDQGRIALELELQQAVDERSGKISAEHCETWSLATIPRALPRRAARSHR